MQTLLFGREQCQPADYTRVLTSAGVGDGVVSGGLTTMPGGGGDIKSAAAAGLAAGAGAVLMSL